MSLTQVHPSKMPIGMKNQYDYLKKIVRVCFQGTSPEDDLGLQKPDADFMPISYDFFIIPSVYSSRISRDVFKIQMRLFDSIKIDGKDFVNSKDQFFGMLSTYRPKEGDGRMLDRSVSRSVQGLHVLIHQWEGQYYRDTHTFSLLIQGLQHIPED